MTVILVIDIIIVVKNTQAFLVNAGSVEREGTPLESHVHSYILHSIAHRFTTLCKYLRSVRRVTIVRLQHEAER